jgi:hypothetical protein
VNIKSVLFLACIAALTGACTTIKPYEKEYLLNPLMDDGRTADLTPAMPSVGTSTHEKFATGAGGGAGSSCPTCGG